MSSSSETTQFLKTEERFQLGEYTYVDFTPGDLMDNTRFYLRDDLIGLNPFTMRWANMFFNREWNSYKDLPAVPPSLDDMWVAGFNPEIINYGDNGEPGAQVVLTCGIRPYAIFQVVFADKNELERFLNSALIMNNALQATYVEALIQI